MSSTPPQAAPFLVSGSRLKREVPSPLGTTVPDMQIEFFAVYIIRSETAGAGPLFWAVEIMVHIMGASRRKVCVTSTCAVDS